ncbi:hypothetical protein E2986_13242 [Frieseomelitta varia]|uniref:Uncharacterized protein n=1 Tax=Frieseomelitta varia TaxID=561572 RepID=A0A833SAV3_9HYME|nr:hypothetical protein E2986_13242 [Frieseomelitta varia]
MSYCYHRFDVSSRCLSHKKWSSKRHLVCVIDDQQQNQPWLRSTDLFYPAHVANLHSTNAISRTSGTVVENYGHQGGGQAEHRLEQLKKATDRIQKEIEEVTEREHELRNVGSIKTTSHETVDSKLESTFHIEVETCLFNDLHSTKRVDRFCLLPLEDKK